MEKNHEYSQQQNYFSEKIIEINCDKSNPSELLLLKDKIPNTYIVNNDSGDYRNIVSSNYNNIEINDNSINSILYNAERKKNDKEDCISNNSKISSKIKNSEKNHNSENDDNVDTIDKDEINVKDNFLLNRKNKDHRDINYTGIINYTKNNLNDYRLYNENELVTWTKKHFLTEDIEEDFEIKEKDYCAISHESILKLYENNRSKREFISLKENKHLNNRKTKYDLRCFRNSKNSKHNKNTASKQMLSSKRGPFIIRKEYKDNYNRREEINNEYYNGKRVNDISSLQINDVKTKSLIITDNKELLIHEYSIENKSNNRLNDEIIMKEEIHNNITNINNKNANENYNEDSHSLTIKLSFIDNRLSLFKTEMTNDIKNETSNCGVYKENDDKRVKIIWKAIDYYSNQSLGKFIL